MGAHRLDGVLRDRIGTESLHGVDGSKCANPFVEIDVNGRKAVAWSWDAQREVALVRLADQSIRDTLTVEWRP